MEQGDNAVLEIKSFGLKNEWLIYAEVFCLVLFFCKWFKITMQSWKIAGGISLYILLLCHYILDGKARHQLMALTI
jgi:hypothetical protein